MSEGDQPRFAAGWYPDPAGGGGQRFYDGNEWTENRTPPGATGGGPMVQTKTSGMAIASLVLGLIGLGIGSVLAIIFGLMAKKNIRESGGMETGGGMATAGIVLGILGVVGALILIVSGLAASGGGAG